MSKTINMVGGGGAKGIKLSRIEITTPPTKTSYLPGDRFDNAGMIVTARYTNGATMRATGYTWSPDGDMAEGTTSVTVIYSEGGTTATAEIAVTVERKEIPIPTQKGEIVFTGTEQSPEWNAYDTEKMSIGGQTTATNAGSYVATFTPSFKYKWPDSSTEAKNVSWRIDKASGSITLNPINVTLDPAHTTATVSVTRLGDGTITASSNSGICDVSISGTTMTISSVGEQNGTATITVTASQSTNYTSATAVCNVTAAFIGTYGVEWDGTSTTVWARTDDAAGFTNPVPAINNGTGSSPFDDIMPWSGMQKVEDPNAGTLVSIPKYWYKLTKNGNRLRLQIANGPADGFHVSPAHMDRGDGKGERDVVYVGRYHCAGSGWKSESGQNPHAQVTRPNANSGIHTLGADVWLWDWAINWTIKMLYLVEFADWNSQKAIGKGCGNNSSAQAMGYTDAMRYHTGTTQANRNTYGLGTQYRWIEGLWDNVYDWVGGCYYNNSGLNVITNPSQYSDNSGGTLIGKPVGGWSSAFNVSSISGHEWCIWPTAASGSETTFLTDGWYFLGSNPCLYVGGDYYQDGYYGLFCVDYSGASNASANIGCRLQKLP